MKHILTPSEKEDLNTRFLSGESVKTLSKQTGIPRSTLYAWFEKFREEKSSKKKEISLKNYRLLENKVKRLEGIIDVLKTSNCLVNDSLEIKLPALQALHKNYNVHLICEALEVSRGTFYNYIFRNKRDNSIYAKRREEFRIIIQEIYDDSKQIYGAKKITAVMKEKGYRISSETVREIMQDLGIASIRQSAKKIYDKEQRKNKNYLNQEFNATKPNQIWVSDVTFFRYNNKTFCISAILDLYSRKIVSYQVGMKNSTQLVRNTFKFAYENRNPDTDLIFHTDRGSNYSSKTFCTYLKSLQVTQSFSKAGVPYDNSVMESFFASLKREELYRTKYRSEKEFRTAVENYMIFYNNQRPHAKNGYKTPDKKEAEYLNSQMDLRRV